jgi:hypothetical protein
MNERTLALVLGGLLSAAPLLAQTRLIPVLPAAAPGYSLEAGSPANQFISFQMDMMEPYVGVSEYAGFLDLMIQYRHLEPEGSIKAALKDAVAYVTGDERALYRLAAAGLKPQDRLFRLLQSHHDRLYLAVQDDPRLAEAVRQAREELAPEGVETESAPPPQVSMTVPRGAVREPEAVSDIDWTKALTAEGPTPGAEQWIQETRQWAQAVAQSPKEHAEDPDLVKDLVGAAGHLQTVLDLSDRLGMERNQALHGALAAARSQINEAIQSLVDQRSAQITPGIAAELRTLAQRRESGLWATLDYRVSVAYQVPPAEQVILLGPRTPPEASAAHFAIQPPPGPSLAPEPKSDTRMAFGLLNLGAAAVFSVFAFVTTGALSAVLIAGAAATAIGGLLLLLSASAGKGPARG